ncbi:MAG: hypothetical protein AAF639_45125, partial [Chloroflexota bacterium]
MYQSDYYIEKSSNTFADTLAAFGLAFVLDEIVAEGVQIEIRDEGSVFCIHCSRPICEEWVQACQFFVGAPFLLTYDKNSKQNVIKGAWVEKTQLPEDEEYVVDYEKNKKQNEVYFDWRKKLPAEVRKQLLANPGNAGGPPPPHSEWDLFRAINPASLQTYNYLLGEWYKGHNEAQPIFAELLTCILHMTTTYPNDLKGVKKRWTDICKAYNLKKSTNATAPQLLNPSQGKGTNKSKTQWSSEGQRKEFWILEWLKLVGLRYGGMTRTVQGAKDRKTYVLVPKQLSWAMHKTVMQAFRGTMIVSSSAVKLDILASLRYTRVLLMHCEEARVQNPLAKIFGKRPGDLIGGFQTAFYKDMGQTTAIMNISSINLPSWARINQPEELNQFLGSLDEHLSIIREMNEKNGDQYEMLCLYRDFLSSNTLDPFF